MHLTNNIIPLVSLATVCLLGSGCAFIDNKVDLQYHALSNSPLRDIPPQRVEINVIDQRPESERNSVGSVKNGFGSKTANVISTEPVAQEIHAAIASEFLAAGHDVVRSENNPEVLITVNLRRIDVDTVTNFFDVEVIAEIGTDVTVYNPIKTNSLASFPVSGSSVKSSQLVTESTRELALNAALAEYIRSLIFNEELLTSLRKQNSESEKLIN
ncbi:YajG family lipoprotein [Rubellicoccus peritrichatus]|uniref:YajG family lipoprotein n=1 Tax=Rubellicoccus peritrichatus TaxID=3080537 RepID=A0AAQ3LEJ9_9BACT|nr:YajG family lipoprotein [Puniceicoccus sp. CR14]WOO42505.1 YajG family lipoprotein [Puniceicoccus sp. CR14]